jgi:hypothetical protein
MRYCGFPKGPDYGANILYPFPRQPRLLRLGYQAAHRGVFNGSCLRCSEVLWRSTF